MVENLELECDFCGSMTKDFSISPTHEKIACVWCAKEIELYENDPNNDRTRGVN